MNVRYNDDWPAPVTLKDMILAFLVFLALSIHF